MAEAFLYNESCPGSAPIRARWCESFLCQLRGLTFRRSLPRGEGLLLVQPHDSRVSSSIHMLWVFTDLAVVWIDSAQRVVDVQLARSWRPAYWPSQPARYVLEMAPQHLEDFHKGDRVRIEKHA